jgi:hypothetical protein
LASPIAFFDQLPVFTKSTVLSERVRFIGSAENCAVAPPCMNSTR